MKGKLYCDKCIPELDENRGININLGSHAIAFQSKGRTLVTYLGAPFQELEIVKIFPINDALKFIVNIKLMAQTDLGGTIS